MGFRRRTRRRAIVAGAAIAHHRDNQAAEAQQAPADYQEPAPAPAPAPPEPAQYAPPPADPADEIEHLAQLHASGAMTDEEFAAAKAKVLGT
ncbi:MAG: SHOCT domain-containing protein [Actinomycetota bacterium]